METEPHRRGAVVWRGGVAAGAVAGASTEPLFLGLQASGAHLGWGGLEAIMAARAEGLTRFIGPTTHGAQAPAVISAAGDGPVHGRRPALTPAAMAGL